MIDRVNQIMDDQKEEIGNLRKLVIKLQHELVEKNKTIHRAEIRMEAAFKLAQGE